MVGSALGDSRLPRIRVIATTGEAAAPDLARRLVDVADEVWNLYGPTETTVWATGHRLQRERDRPLIAPRPRLAVRWRTWKRVYSTSIACRSRRARRASCGSAVRAVGRGYRGNEQLTRERFAVLGQDGRRFYRTGDVVVADVDGTLHYFGRCDDQMKVRGVRIEPMEVEFGDSRLPRRNPGGRDVVRDGLGLTLDCRRSGRPPRPDHQRGEPPPLSGAAAPVGHGSVAVRIL